VPKAFGELLNSRGQEVKKRQEAKGRRQKLFVFCSIHSSFCMLFQMARVRTQKKEVVFS
jgi:hypothetical protein